MKRQIGRTAGEEKASFAGTNRTVTAALVP
jgi:hypothetical protein